jgi:hypothetical protein
LLCGVPRADCIAIPAALATIPATHPETAIALARIRKSFIVRAIASAFPLRPSTAVILRLGAEAGFS